MSESFASASQAEVNTHVAALSEQFKIQARSAVDAWRQVPLLAIVAGGRLGWNDAHFQAAQTGLHPLGSVTGNILRIRCTDGAIVRFTKDVTLAYSAEILKAAAVNGYRLSDWDGNQVLAELLKEAQVPIASWYTPEDTHQKWIKAIRSYRAGLLAGWEKETGAINAVSEIMISLAGEWDKSFGKLLRTSVELARQSGNPEIENLAIFKANIDY